MNQNHFASMQPHHLDEARPMLLSPQHAEYSGASHEIHAHPEGQMYIALQGVIVIEAGGRRTVLPPGRLKWIPPHVPHGATILGTVSRPTLVGYTLHLAPQYCGGLAPQAQVLRMSLLAHALLQRMATWPCGVAGDQAARRLMAVFIDEMNAAEHDPLHLTMPRHPRLLTMAAAIAEDPADATELDTWADRLGLSRRSITRHFRTETGMSLVEWRQVARLQKGMQMLTAGTSVTTVALSLGYDSVSSFIALFRRILGTTPARFAQFAQI
jgi:AraC-like DNA-binding protein